MTAIRRDFDRVRSESAGLRRDLDRSRSDTAALLLELSAAYDELDTIYRRLGPGQARRLERAIQRNRERANWRH